MGKDNKRKKGSIIVICILLAIFLFAFLFTHLRMAGFYSQEHHLREIERRISAKGNNFAVENVYPLYDENERFSYALVEYKSGSYEYIAISYNNLLSVITGVMYLREIAPDYCWERYVYTDDFDKQYREYELDDSGDRKIYTRSHFAQAGITDEKKYLLKVKSQVSETVTYSVSGYVPAVKRGDKFLNLTSLKEFSLGNGELLIGVEVANIYFVNKPQFAL